MHIKASKGRISTISLDDHTYQQLEHLEEFFRRAVDKTCSRSVLVRWAIDKAINSGFEGNPFLELRNLEKTAEGRTMAPLKQIPRTERYSRWKERTR